MKNLATFLNRALLLATVPAALAFTGCGNDDDDPVVTPVPDQGKIMLVHAAPTSSAAVKIVANDNKELGQATYGTNSSYVNVVAGAQSLKVNDATSGATSVTQTLAVEKNKNYSFFAYSPNANLGSAAGLAVVDDLTAPAAGKAKIRIVHLGVSAPSPLNLSLPAPTIGTTEIITNVGFGTASSFTELTPNTYNLAVSTGAGATGMVEVSVGDGTGTNPTGAKAYAAGKIYTILVRGIKSTSVATNLRLQAVVIENN
ncbi:DUF4397 domain-containing protein [Hymenobacter algoricola]|uniref:DUF4397 domain-containing protein n=1 Tax=Hymenobacter algoricola TaxID=486267 RepID=A0ABP7NMC6_9BACT